MKVIDAILYAYSTILTLLLITTSLFASSGTSNLVLSLLFMPVALYLVFTAISAYKRLQILKSQHQTQSQLDMLLTRNQRHFLHDTRRFTSLIQNLTTQRNRWYLASLALIIAVITTLILQPILSSGAITNLLP